MTASQTAPRPPRWKTNDRMLFGDDPNHFLFFIYFLAHVPRAIRRLILRGRYFRKVAHKQHYRYPSCSRKHVLVSGKALEGEEGGSRLERGRQEIKNKEYNMKGEGG